MMGLMDVLLCSTFFALGEDIPLYGTPQSVEQIRLHKDANNVGNSNFQPWLADPQPSPDLLTTYNGGFAEMSDSQGVESITPNSISYCNGRGTLGGITDANWEEIQLLLNKHFRGDD